MKTIKKIAGLFFCICMCACLLSFPVKAAEGTIMFSDPETKVGENVAVDLRITTNGETIGDVHVTMSYDPEMLEFVDGENVTAGESGTLQYDALGAGDSTEAKTTINFKALKQGETKIQVTGSTAYLFSDEELYLTEGDATIKIGEGSANKTESTAEDVSVVVDGKNYNFSDNFSDALIPENFSKVKLQYAGTERNFITNSTGTINLGYLVDESGEGNFFLYDTENASFSPYVEITLSDSNFMVLLQNVDGIKLPKKYTSVSITYNGWEFPAWSDTENEGFSIVYGMNNEGTKSLYQYDQKEGTFQRINIAEEKEEAKPDSSLLGKIKNKLGNFADALFIVMIVVVVLLLLFLIVALVKLNHRNLELDDWYAEYGTDEEKQAISNNEIKNKKNKKNKKNNKKQNQEDDYDDFDDSDDDYYYDDDDESYDDSDDDYYYDDDDYYYDDDDYEDEVESENDEDYYYDSDDDKYDDDGIDFIDL